MSDFLMYFQPRSLHFVEMNVLSLDSSLCKKEKLGDWLIYESSSRLSVESLVGVTDGL